MLMSKHHENALIFLGIAVCAGFLLTIPAVADSGQGGLMALESGELLPFSPGNLSAIGDTLEHPTSGYSPMRGTQQTRPPRYSRRRTTQPRPPPRRT